MYIIFVLFQDLLERIFRLFDVERKDHLVQEDWFEFLKERLRYAYHLRAY